MEEKASTLTAARKQRGKALPENLTPPEEVKAYKQVAVNNSIHSTGTPGITALDLQVRAVEFELKSLGQSNSYGRTRQNGRLIQQ